jgi:dephospho-CoA kinase
VIAQKEAELARLKAKDEVNVTEVQKRLEVEMDFSFGFGGADELYD